MPKSCSSILHPHERWKLPFSIWLLKSSLQLWQTKIIKFAKIAAAVYITINLRSQEDAVATHPTPNCNFFMQIGFSKLKSGALPYGAYNQTLQI